MNDKTQRKQASPEVVPGVEPLEPGSVRRSPTRQRMRRRSGTGDPKLDAQIEALVAGVSDIGSPDLLRDITQTAFRLGRTANRGEMKLVSRSLRELGRAFRIFAPYHGVRKVSIFGSARTDVEHAEYRAARDFSSAIAARGWMVITGAGPGIMAAGHEGAGAEKSFGVGIKLPTEQSANGFILGDPKLIDFKYFFTRKIMFMKESDAFVLLPGGYGTMDEGFELLTLMQTGKTAIRPVVLLEPEGSTYWTEWASFIREHVVERGLASPEDLSLFCAASTIDEAIAEIERFYSNYDSARYVKERLVLRLKRAPSEVQMQALNREFADVVASGRIERITITSEEAKEHDAENFARIAFHPVHNFGRIRQIIDRLNAIP
ncbi:MAG: TIGR00730 family Rossman fold protein [Chloroflexi bacterium]|nr:TIGR00730 family Rossman fold protein [Chloroflexota bacterium]